MGSEYRQLRFTEIVRIGISFAGTGVLVGTDTRVLSLFPPPCKDTGDLAVCKPGRELLPETELADILLLDFHPPEP